jgi:hypothetical protein
MHYTCHWEGGFDRILDLYLICMINELLQRYERIARNVVR